MTTENMVGHNIVRFVPVSTSLLRIAGPSVSLPPRDMNQGPNSGSDWPR